MNRLEFFSVVLTTLLIILISLSNCYSSNEKIRWIPTQPFLEHLVVPAGYERSNSSGEYDSFYVARVKNSTNWLPGKYSPSFRQCLVGVNGKEEEKPETDCELLVYPKGTTSWIYTEREESSWPEDMLRGGGYPGEDNKNRDLFICRARREGQVLLGRFNMHSKRKTCYTTLDGVEYKHKTFEVLTKNFLAKVTGVKFQE